MATFQYKALDRSSNKEVKKTIEAANQAETIANIKKQGLLPIEVKSSGKTGKSNAATSAGAGKNAKKSVLSLSLGSGIKPKMVTDFTRQLSTLTDAGLPMVQSCKFLPTCSRRGL